MLGKEESRVRGVRAVGGWGAVIIRVLWGGWSGDREGRVCCADRSRERHSRRREPRRPGILEAWPGGRCRWDEMGELREG